MTISTVELNGALAATMIDAPGQGTTFTYLNYTSEDEERRHIEVVRPAGAGCTQDTFVNYSPFATVDDNSCIEGRHVRMDFATVVNDVSAIDWYKHGVISVSEPAVYGGYSTFPPILLPTANSTWRGYRHVFSGQLSVQIFGYATFRVRLAEANVILLNQTESNLTNTRDRHGFELTIGTSQVNFVVPVKSIQQQVVSIDGAVIGESDTGTVIVGPGALESPAVVSVATEYHEPSGVTCLKYNSEYSCVKMDMIEKRFSIVPHRLRFINHVIVIVTLDKNQPTRMGNQEKIILRTPDEQTNEWRAVPGSFFSSRKAYLNIDHFSVLVFRARAQVRMIDPYQVGLSGITSVILDGVDLRGDYASVLNTFCKFGEKYKHANFFDSRDPRTHGDAVRCLAPILSQAGFMTVEVHHSDTLVSSNSGWRVLFTSASSISSLVPPSCFTTGGALVTLRGSHFSSLAHGNIASRSGDSGASAARMGDATRCMFGVTSSIISGYVISSTMAVCEAPAALPHTITSQNQLVDVSLAGYEVSSSFRFQYILPTVDTDSKWFPTGSSGRKHRPTDIEEGRSTFDMSSVLISNISHVLVKDYRGGGHGNPHVSEIRCKFDTVFVSSRTSPRPSCISPAKQNKESGHGFYHLSRSVHHLVHISSVLLNRCIFVVSCEPCWHISMSALLSTHRLLSELEFIDSQLFMSYFSQTDVLNFEFELKHMAQLFEITWGALTPHFVMSYNVSVFSFERLVSYKLYPLGSSTSVMERGFVLTNVMLPNVASNKNSRFNTRTIQHSLLTDYSAASFIISAVGGSICGDIGGGAIWLVASIEPNTVSNPSRGVSNGGFRRGSGSFLFCRYAPLKTYRNVSEASEILPAFLTSARVISSAVASCELPAFQNESSRYSGRATYDTSTPWFLSSVQLNSAGANSKSRAIKISVLPEPLFVVATIPLDYHRDGGSVISVSWQTKNRYYEILARVQLACMFGTIGPISLFRRADETRRDGFCISPAREGHLAQPGKPSRRTFTVSLHLPYNGQMKNIGQNFEPQVFATIPNSSVVSKIFSPANAVSSFFRCVNMVSEHGLTVQSVAFETTAHLHSCKTWTYSDIMRFSFATVTLFETPLHHSDGVFDSVSFKYNTPAELNTVDPIWVPVYGGALLTITGKNLRIFIDDSLQSSISCVFGGHASDIIAVSSTLARCELFDSMSGSGTIGGGFSKLRFDSGEVQYINQEANVLQVSPLKLSETLLIINSSWRTKKLIGRELHFMQNPRINHLSPDIADGFGGLLVSVHGSYFNDFSSSLCCLFGTISVAATVLNNTNIECVTPVHAEVKVSFTLNSVAHRPLGTEGQLEFDFLFGS